MFSRKQASYDTPYDEGMQACREGKEFWENPHCNPSGLKDEADLWFAGWCYQKQQMSEMAENPEE